MKKTHALLLSTLFSLSLAATRAQAGDEVVALSESADAQVAAEAMLNQARDAYAKIHAYGDLQAERDAAKARAKQNHDERKEDDKRAEKRKIEQAKRDAEIAIEDLKLASKKLREKNREAAKGDDNADGLCEKKGGFWSFFKKLGGAIKGSALYVVEKGERLATAEHVDEYEEDVRKLVGKSICAKVSDEQMVKLLGVQSFGRVSAEAVEGVVTAK